MASPVLLLTSEQVQRSREVILSSIAKLPASYPNIEPISLQLIPVVHSNQLLGTPLSSADAEVRSGAPYPPPPGLSTWQNPIFHDQVISTFFTVAQQSVGFIPNAVGSNPDNQVQGFNRFLAELQRYSPYLVFKDGKNLKFSHDSVDCQPLLNAAIAFTEAAGRAMGSLNAQKMAKEVVGLVERAVKAFGSSSSARLESTQYSFFVIEGNVAGNRYPVAFVLYSFVVMERHTSGKSTVATQEVQMYSYAYEIQSPIVTENASILAVVPVVPSKTFADDINTRLFQVTV